MAHSPGCSQPNKMVPKPHLFPSVQIKSGEPGTAEVLSHPSFFYRQCLAAWLIPLSSPERDQGQHKAHRSIPALSSSGEDILSSHRMGWGWGLPGQASLDLSPKSKLELSHRRALTSLSAPLGPRLSSAKWRELISRILTDGICTEPD